MSIPHPTVVPVCDVRSLLRQGHDVRAVTRADGSKAFVWLRPLGVVFESVDPFSGRTTPRGSHEDAIREAWFDAAKSGTGFYRFYWRE